MPLHGLGVVISGGIAGLTLAGGMVVQPLARRLARKSVNAIRFYGLAAGAVGFLLAAVTVRFTAPVLLIPTAVALGASYGMLLVAGLSRVEALAAPDDLASVTGVFYCPSYLGFGIPYIMTALNSVLSPMILFVPAVAIVALLIPMTASKRDKPENSPSPARVLPSAQWPKQFPA